MAVDYIANEYFVAVKLRDGDSNLGFMTPVTSGSDFTKRKQTVIGWVGNHKGKTDTKNVTNIPRFGFILDTNKRRYRTDNVVWEMKHPEGFNFQITSENFCDLMKNCDIYKGKIDKSLVFIRRERENYLTWHGSDIYNNAKTFTEFETKISIKDIKIGDEVIFKNGNREIYRGSCHVLAIPNEGCKYEKLAKFDIDMKSKLKHMFSGTGTSARDKKIISVRSSPHIIQIVSSGNNVCSTKETIKKINNGLRCKSDYLTLEDSIGYRQLILAVDEKPMQLSNMKAVMIELNREHELNSDEYCRRIKWTTRNDMPGYFGYVKNIRNDRKRNHIDGSWNNVYVERHITTRSASVDVAGGTQLIRTATENYPGYYNNKWNPEKIELDREKFGKHKFIEKVFTQVMERV